MFKVSVVIPVYNAEKYLKKCLESVLAQSYKEWEIVAIDDGSEDSSYSILKEFSNLDERINIYTQKNSGPGYTRNKAIEMVSGDYIVFLDADDYIENSYFKNLVSCIRANNSDVVFIDVVQETPDGEIIKYEIMSKYKNKSKDTIIRHQMTGKLPWGGCRKAIKTALIKENQIEYSTDEVGEEALFSFRVLYNSRIISFVDVICYHYVNHLGSQSKKGKDDPWGSVARKLKNYLQEQGMLNKYQTTVNSFGYTALIVSIYRIAQNYKIMKALKRSKSELKNFKKDFDFSLDKKSLEKRVKPLTIFLKMEWIFPVVCVAKVKSLIRKK